MAVYSAGDYLFFERHIMAGGRRQFRVTRRETGEHVAHVRLHVKRFTRYWTGQISPDGQDWLFGSEPFRTGVKSFREALDVIATRLDAMQKDN